MIEQQEYNRWTYDEDIIKLFDLCADKVQIISFRGGMCGGLLYRILAHNPSYYWEDSFSEIKSNQERKAPLDWPDHDIGYNHLAEPFPDEKGNWYSKNPQEQQLNAVHVGCYQLPNNESVEIRRWGKDRVLKKFLNYFKNLHDKKLLIRTHDMLTQTKFPNIITIRICGHNANRNKMYARKETTYPIEQNNVVNININNLLSVDYSIFEKEYFNLCNNLNINATPIPVRGYILNYLDRINNHSNKVIPRIK